MRPLRILFCLAVVFALSAQASVKPLEPRKGATLDGEWQVEQGALDQQPAQFGHTVAVPGLIDMAKPAFTEVGKKSPQRQAFWYRRTFKLESATDRTLLLIRKARYGTKVFINDQLAGEHLPCFTPAMLDISKLVKPAGQENTLVIRVGADRESVPAGEPSGWDFEKYLYIPGIYDSVELIQTSDSYIRNVQTVPDIQNGKVRIVAEIQGGSRAADLSLKAEVVEAASARTAGNAIAAAAHVDAGAVQTVDFVVPIDQCKLWSPENPFLYELRLSTGSDAVSVRFGMRTFRFDPQTKRAMLNEKPYYLRGTNICAYRFFEDDQRGDRPWREEWVRRVHEKFKTMHWNSMRYCIGFPPDFWYDIADETGFLIQDEFPIWLLGKAPESPVAEKIIPEYTEWMRHRWNHACVVIWDAQNESFTAESGKALTAVRKLDLSNRPWENGWGEPQADTDCVESHPYVFIKAWEKPNPISLRDLEKLNPTPALQQAQRKRDVAIIINEYAWLWLNRDGSTTCLTKNVYDILAGPNATPEQRRVIYARTLSAKTEFWRCHRKVAGVLHFCGLGYSRPSDKPRPEGGATSDHFVDMERLIFEPNFEKYMREAFNPVALMLDYWGAELAPAQEQTFKVNVINDLDKPWSGPVTLRLIQNDREIARAGANCSVDSCGQQIVSIPIRFPQASGTCTLSAELTDGLGVVIHSLREVKLK